ncbi:hypothetical protein TherJR_0893 [Thermincola potens JR]|uniref:Uncharacterized protein n=1 Tax=Thermincola potens (strain JR) TaxID=635013 RepID=D5XDB2_THEPJ|nr:hypothetical protein TherJR_0893 [Thermincola potens JR]
MFPFREKVMPGAFKETIQVDDIRALVVVFILIIHA